jgi:hypothetical protein
MPGNHDAWGAEARLAGSRSPLPRVRPPRYAPAADHPGAERDVAILSRYTAEHPEDPRWFDERFSQELLRRGVAQWRIEAGRAPRARQGSSGAYSLSAAAATSVASCSHGRRTAAPPQPTGVRRRSLPAAAHGSRATTASCAHPSHEHAIRTARRPRGEEGRSAGQPARG